MPESTRLFFARYGITLAGAILAAALLTMSAEAHAQSSACAKAVQGPDGGERHPIGLGRCEPG